MINEYRKKLNDALNGLGREDNSPTKSLANQIEYLGGIFKTNVNFRRAGAVAGVIAPYVGAYILSDYVPKVISDESIRDLTAFLTFTISSSVATMIGLPVFTGALGYHAGKALDKLMGDPSLNVNKCKYVTRQENKLR